MGIEDSATSTEEAVEPRICGLRPNQDKATFDTTHNHQTSSVDTSEANLLPDPNTPPSIATVDPQKYPFAVSAGTILRHLDVDAQ